MYRWSKIPEIHRPEIISDVNNDKLLTLIVQDWNYKKIKRKDAAAPNAVAASAARVAWEGHYYYPTFKNVIDKNIPCVIMHKVKNKWTPEIDTIVCFMTGECNDVFLIHPDDLTEWDPNEEI